MNDIEQWLRSWQPPAPRPEFDERIRRLITAGPPPRAPRRQRVLLSVRLPLALAVAVSIGFWLGRASAPPAAANDGGRLPAAGMFSGSDQAPAVVRQYPLPPDYLASFGLHNQQESLWAPGSLHVYVERSRTN